LGCISNRTRLHASRDGNYCLLPFYSQMVQRLVKLNFLEEIGGVKTARREAESILLARALLKNRRVQVKDEKRMLKLVQKNKVLLQGLTHCDRLLGKFSCFLPGYKNDFELYPTISQLGEFHLDPAEVLRHRRKVVVEGREVWMTSDSDRVLIRVIHAMFRHNF